MKKLRIATTNRGKLKEFCELLEPLGYEVIGTETIPNWYVEEDGKTFQENAIKKAQILCQHTGDAALADDSGLEVIALSGAPGVYSARYANADGADQDAANRQKLLAAMADVPEAQRNARFVCVLAYCAPNQPPQCFEGIFNGRIATEERGHNGFGYDSIFFIPELHCTAAELDPAEKNRRSHRGQALQKFLAYLGQPH